MDKNNDFDNWYPTYGVMTAERILGRYHISLDYKTLIAAIKNPKSIYHNLIKVPIKNVYGGILMDHAKEYQNYVQKLFVDYLVSGQADAPEDSPGQTTREKIEALRQELKSLNAQFENQQANRRALVASSQSLLIGFGRDMVKQLKEMAKKINKQLQSDRSVNDLVSLINQTINENKPMSQKTPETKSTFWDSLSEKLKETINAQVIQACQKHLDKIIDIDEQVTQNSEFLMENADDSLNQMKDSRSAFYQLILRVKEQLSLLPEYRDGEERAQANLSSITFDPRFGSEQNDF